MNRASPTPFAPQGQAGTNTWSMQSNDPFANINSGGNPPRNFQAQ